MKRKINTKTQTERNKCITDRKEAKREYAFVRTGMFLEDEEASPGKTSGWKKDPVKKESRRIWSEKISWRRLER